MAKTQRRYENYEELGRRLMAADEALGDLSSFVFGMFQSSDERGRPVPSTYDVDLMNRHLYLSDLISQLSLEYHAEAPEVPEGKPPIPPPFGAKRGDS